MQEENCLLTNTNHRWGWSHQYLLAGPQTIGLNYFGVTIFMMLNSKAKTVLPFFNQISNTTHRVGAK